MNQTSNSRAVYNDNHLSVIGLSGDGRNRTKAIDLLIRGSGMDLTADLLKRVERKIARARQHAPGAFRARVQLQRTHQNRYRAHVLYELKGNDVSVEHQAHDPVAAINVVADKIRRRLRKRKTARLARRARIKHRI